MSVEHIYNYVFFSTDFAVNIGPIAVACQKFSNKKETKLKFDTAKDPINQLFGHPTVKRSYHLI